jgi:predicted ArsR family transcriptional regulator
MQRLAHQYREGVHGKSAADRMSAIAELFDSRDVSFVVENKDGLPVLKALCCPYTELAEQDRSVCAMERMLFTQLVNEPLRLQECRLDGASCCTFELSSPTVEVLT